jgi:hypothetical protein
MFRMLVLQALNNLSDEQFAEFRTRRPRHIYEMPRCRAILSGIHMLAGGDQTGWLGR